MDYNEAYARALRLLNVRFLSEGELRRKLTVYSTLCTPDTVPAILQTHNRSSDRKKLLIFLPCSLLQRTLPILSGRYFCFVFLVITAKRERPSRRSPFSYAEKILNFYNDSS